MKWLIAEWKGAPKERTARVASALRKMGHECIHVRRDDFRDSRRYLIEQLQDPATTHMLTWQRFFPMQHDIRGALAERNGTLQTVYMDFGFTHHYESVVFDPDGENAASRMAKSWKVANPSPNELDVADAVIECQRRRTDSLAGITVIEDVNLRKPFIFLPLQRFAEGKRRADTVIRYDSDVTDPGKLVRRILELSENFHLIVKAHPLNLGVELGVPDSIDGKLTVIRRAFGPEGEEVNDRLLSGAATVIGINSNMLFRAMVFGIPVIALGRGWFTGSGAYRDVKGLDGLQSVEPPKIRPGARRKALAVALSQQALIKHLDEPEKVRPVLERIGILL